MKKIAIVTGASSGMGRECVLQLSRKYSALEEIWVLARREERLLALQKDVKTPLRIFALDLTEEEAWNAFAKVLSEEKPRVRILVNASGFGKIGAFEKEQLSEETGMAFLNCVALTAVTRLVLPYMPKNSRIIQFASSAAFLPQPGFAVYAATKSYVLSLSRALGRELKNRKITVTAVCPGPVKTEFFDVAESTGNQMPLYKKLVMADPGKVVEKAIKDMEAGKALSVYGLSMKAFRILAKVVPHSLLLPFLGAKKTKG